MIATVLAFGLASGFLSVRALALGILLLGQAQAVTQTAPAVATAAPVANSAAATSGQAAASRPAAPDSSLDLTSGGAPGAAAQPEIGAGEPVKADALRDRRKAAKLYLAGVRELERQRPESAWDQLRQAAELEPDNATYVRAAELARQSTVTQLVELATREASQGNQAAAEADLHKALSIDPSSSAAAEHLRQFKGGSGGDITSTLPSPAGPSNGPAAGGTEIGALAGGNPNLIRSDGTTLGGAVELEPNTADGGKHSFHLHTSARQVIENVFRAYGIEASVHESVKPKQVRLDVDDATFPEAMKVLSLVTDTFYEALDPHRVVVATDTRQNRQQFQRLQMETVYLPGLNTTQLTEVSNMARNIFDAQQSLAEPGAGTLTLRAPGKTLKAFNETVNEMVEGRRQVDLEVKIIELSHISDRETGTTFFQTTSVYNVFSEINSVLSTNQSLVQQIISSGLVPNANTLANQIEILAILVASGQLSGTPFNQGFLPFGGGLTQSILSPSPATLTLSLNSSDTHELDDVHLRLSEDEAGTFKTGERYPIETSQYSSLALTALSGSSTAANQVVPQVQYEDLGLTLKATPNVMRSGDVALTLDLKIEALGGTSLNGIPVLDNRSMAGVVTIKDGETAVLLSDINSQESRALNGLPGVSDIPGLQDISDIQRNINVAKLLILITPTVTRDTHQPVRGRMLMVDKAQGNH
jgi:hypothetical protein